MRIFLIGFMGSGKSHWGKIWAEENHYQFIDLDEEIEKREQETIADIFEQKGEDIFRLLETKLLRETTRYDDCIIACGGGTPCFHNNMQWMLEKGITIYLSAIALYLFENIKHETSKRPLIKKTNEAELLFYTEQTLKKRLPFYEQANLELEAATLTSESFAAIKALIPSTPKI